MSHRSCDRGLMSRRSYVGRSYATASNFLSPLPLRGEVEHVDEDQAESDKENNPSRDNILNIVITDHDTLAHDDDNHRGDEERDPAHHDEHGGGQVDGEDEGAQGPRQTDLKSIGAVVTCKRFMGEIKTF